jgi:hypothetical protein
MLLPQFSRNSYAFRLRTFRSIEQEGTGQVLFFPLALGGKSLGFSVLQEHAVMTPVISIFFSMLIIRHLSIYISIKK